MRTLLLNPPLHGGFDGGAGHGIRSVEKNPFFLVSYRAGIFGREEPEPALKKAIRGKDGDYSQREC